MDGSIRAAFPTWPSVNERFRDVVGAMTEDQLAISPSADRWPIWASVGHTACQRVFGLCDLAGEPGADTTRFTNAAFDCPGDDDLEHVLDPPALVEALDATFRIVERCLDSWTVPMLGEEVRRRWSSGEESVHRRGWILERAFAHDISHITELNETLGRAGLPQVDLWN